MTAVQLDPVALAADAVTEADLALEAVEENAAALRAKVEDLREAIRSGQQIKRGAIVAAEGDAEHADLETEAARRRQTKARDDHRDAQIADAEERLASHNALTDLRESQAAIAQAVGHLARAVSSYNRHQSQVFGELRDLGVNGYTASYARPSQVDLSQVVAKAISSGVGGDLNRLTNADGNGNFRDAVSKAAQR